MSDVSNTNPSTFQVDETKHPEPVPEVPKVATQTNELKETQKLLIHDEVTDKLANVEKLKGLGIDSFEKLKLLGKGDVGKVYLVRLKETDKLFAMKVLTKKDMISRNKIKRVLTEREILSTTDHPFIVSLYCSFQSQDCLYFVMEYCSGGEFYRMLQKQKNKALPESAAKFYAAEVLLALEYLHFKGFIYRDLKPENILIHQSGHIRLSDFDLSKQTVQTLNPKLVKGMFTPIENAKISTKQIQEFNSFVGTEEYIAPEVITGEGHNSSVDWWCFGILLFEMLYGKTPFKGQDQKDTFSHILNKKLVFPDEPPTSKEAKDLIRQLLQADTEKRIGSKCGAADLMQHAFFKGLQFQLIRNMEPPYKPQIKNELDTSHFRQYVENEEEKKELEDKNYVVSENDPFKSFEFSGTGNKDLLHMQGEKQEKKFVPTIHISKN